MKYRRLYMFLAFALMLTLMRLPLYADDAPSGQAGKRDSYGLNPVADSLSMEELRHYLDEIRKKRPAVALVLSGGGAKGASHIGVIQYLDSLEIPVDVVLGTSMGGLVGGLFALGYTPHDMDSLIRTIDWNTALSDKIPRGYESYARSRYKEKVLLSFPFYYGKEDSSERKEERGYARPRRKRGSIHLGADNEDAPETILRDELISSLPAGFAYGQNVNNILSSLSAGYQDNMDFIDLPVPFVCVATEMVTAKPKIWYGGKMTTAMRSTMSIPGVFAPVKTDGMVLVDGGMRNNYPTDLAKEMGADIIIGVDLSSGFRDYSQLNDLKDIIFQGIDMLGRESYERNVPIPDVTIRPYLPEYNMMSFDDKSIGVIIKRGYDAAAKEAVKLDSIKALIGPYRQELRNKKAIDLNIRPVRISDIVLDGVSGREAEYLTRKISLEPNTVVFREDIENAVATIFGTESFEYVTYELQGTSEPFNLLLHCKKGPMHQLGVSGRFDSEEILSVLLNIGLNVHKLRGSTLDFTGKVGLNPSAKLHYYFNGSKGPTFNANFSVKWVDRNRLKFGSSDYNIAYLNVRDEIYLSNIRFRKFDIKLGIRNDFYRLSHVMNDDVIGDYKLNGLNNSYLILFANLKADTFDDGYFPTRGFTMGIGYEWCFAGLRHDINPFHAVTFDFKTVAQAGCFAWMPSLYARYLFGGDPALPYLNLMGGSLAGRYLDQQLPFVGINFATSMRNFLTEARMDFRFKLFKNNYLTAIANYAWSVSDIEDYFNVNKFSGVLGVGLKYSYNTIIGPVEFTLHWRSRNRRAGAYLNVGLNF